MAEKLNDAETVVAAQQAQLVDLQNRLSILGQKTRELEERNTEQSGDLQDISDDIASLYARLGVAPPSETKLKQATIPSHLLAISPNENAAIEKSMSDFSTIIPALILGDDWKSYVMASSEYLRQRNMAPKDIYRSFSATELEDIHKNIEESFGRKQVTCDKYDYMIAGTCGLIGGLVDILYVGTPTASVLTPAADASIDKVVQLFARLNGWKGPKEGSDPIASAIGFLEKWFKVNYDQAHGSGKNGVDGLFKMGTKNHHLKSMGHWPDIIGLFASISDQWKDTATFVSDGRVIVIDTTTFELRGNTVLAKIYAGFVNWLGHLLSDVAGSSGGRGQDKSGRGSGLPIPFYGLLQFVTAGNFGQHRQSFAQIAVQVFERGYDLRHGMALALPVMLTELLTRFMSIVKNYFVGGISWQSCSSVGASSPNLQRMLLVAHGSLVLLDTADAGLRSGGNTIVFLLRANLIAWTRFGTLALEEILSLSHSKLDTDAVHTALMSEYERMLH